MKISRIHSDGFKKLNSALQNIKETIAKVGWIQKKEYPDSSMTTAGAAALAEFGSPAKNIPPRPILRPTISAQKNIWSAIAGAEYKKTLAGKQTAEGAMEILGLKAASDARETITKIFEPPLSPKTIAARLREYKDKKTVGNLTKPLVDTKIMLNSLTNTVEHE